VIAVARVERDARDAVGVGEPHGLEVLPPSSERNTPMPPYEEREELGSPGADPQALGLGRVRRHARRPRWSEGGR
jgi:hypothetical protein